MTITPSALLSLPVITTGTESGLWGDYVNNGLTSYVDIAIAGGLSVSITTADVTLTKTAGTNAATGIASTTAQYAILNITGAKTAARNLNLPVTSKQYTINNAGTGGFLLTVRGVTPTTGVTLVDGEKAIVAWNGSDFVKISSTAGIGLVLLATVNPTAAANVDFLNTFTSTYNNYLILGNDMKFAADDTLRMRFAVAGTADSSSNYVNNANGPGINTSITTTSFTASNTVGSSGLGCNFSILVANANDATGLKSVDVSTAANDASGATSFIYFKQMNGYFAANAVTGFRLFANSASNFAATGSVRVYGYAST
jgi:hypothetical protein